MSADSAKQVVAANRLYYLGLFKTGFLFQCLKPRFRNDQRFPDTQRGSFGHRRNLNNQIFHICTAGDAAIAGHSPRCRRPNHRRRPFKGGSHRVYDRKAHPDGRGGVIEILDFRLGQRRLFDDRP